LGAATVFQKEPEINVLFQPIHQDARWSLGIKNMDPVMNAFYIGLLGGLELF
jgi:hypothetical protein